MTRHHFKHSTTVDEVVRVDAALNRVFSQRGVDTCCGGQRTLAQAAAEAGIEVSDLLRALDAEAAPTAPPTPAASPAGTPAAAGAAMTARTAAARSALFFVGSLFFALTFGVVLGAAILIWLALHGGEGPLPLWFDAVKTAHAYSQVFGFAGLFVMGVALHAAPRFKSGELALPGLMPVALWLQLGGVFVVAVGVLVGGFVAVVARLLGSAALMGRSES